ncbi:MraY family glycosyltransferase [Ureibacillus sinduriensis]|uniref:UDP-N-acetylmuramyl pentapeptide phosphotransferase n=1 Tax=Ureibacillus sinduriensis BLB-1 = JCM 15800 TaxID=1384057 RepID=A0A0A3IQ37_9BACL|nr:UDP-N-acetylmuramyl pentapeptide phosphotransferase [Ureibacillus sinduriensis]KGR76957.1 UDP-N-acetylmuramyl pentapeptide phosphotransferase [Ureibacillus sinduriensis BLB-1 = JCM 15800]
MLYVSLLIGLAVIVITIKLTGKFQLSSIWLLLGQMMASFILMFFGNLELSHINHMELGYLTIPFSLLFLLGITNVMNTRKEQSPLILLLPCIAFFCFFIAGQIMGDKSVSMIAIIAALSVMSILLYGHFSGRGIMGKTLTTSIGFVIAMLSLSLLKVSFVMIYVPIFTLALPIVLYLFVRNKFTDRQATFISSSAAVLFSAIIFVAPFMIIWNMIIGLTVILVISQLSSKYRFI